MTAGRRGLYSNLGLPGTGLSKRTRLASGNPNLAPPAKGGRPRESHDVIVRWPPGCPDPQVLTAADQSPVPPALAQAVIRNNRSAIVELGLEQARINNQRLEQSIHIHLQAIAPDAAAALLEESLNLTDLPTEPQLSPPGWWLKLIPPWYRARLARYDGEWAEYHAQCQRIEARNQCERAALANQIQQAQGGQPEAMTRLLTRLIEQIDFPYETEAAFEFSGQTLILDVDLPEIEDLPATESRFNQRSLQLTERPLSDRAARLNYATHVHAIGVLLASLAFAGLPSIDTVIFSGFSQREDPATGQTIDEYLLSVQIPRNQWQMINFERLGELDPIAVLEPFLMKRNMTKTGIFRAIDPLG